MEMSHPVLMNPAILHGESPDGGPLRRSTCLKRIPDWLLMAIALLPSIVWFVKRLNDGGDEPLGLLSLALAALLAWRDRTSLKSGGHCGTIGALMLLSSVLMTGTFPPMLRAALAITGMGIQLGMQRRPGLLGLLVLSLPVVSSLQFYAGYPMRLAAAGGAVGILELGGIFVSRSGVGIVIGGTNIAVDPACSGIRMLWHALVAAMALASIHRLSWRATFAAASLAILLVVPANAVRAAWLAIEESGRIRASGLSHDSVGLVCFIFVLLPLWFVVVKQAGPLETPETSRLHGGAQRMILLVSAVMSPFFMLRPQPQFHPSACLQPPAEFTYDGLTLPLHPLPSTPEETAFGKSFPGSLSSHQWGGSQVILRRVTTATRSLHPSRDCLHAAGYETTDAITERHSDGTSWSSFHATRNGIRLTVRERIVSEQDGSSWTDVTAWYWSALWYPLNGPWRAETVISE